MATISLDYTKVMGEVTRLNTIASELSTLQTNAQNALKDMNSYWEGAAAKEFAAANEKWRKEMKSVEKEITDLAKLIKKVADDIKEAEARAKAAITGC